MHVLIARAYSLRVVKRQRAYPGSYGEGFFVWLRVPGVVDHGENAADISVEIGSARRAKWNRGQLDPGAGDRGVVKPHLIVARATDVIVQWPVTRRASVEGRRLETHRGRPVGSSKYWSYPHTLQAMVL